GAPLPPPPPFRYVRQVPQSPTGRIALETSQAETFWGWLPSLVPFEPPALTLLQRFVLANPPANLRYSPPPAAAPLIARKHERTASDHAWTSLDWIRPRSPDHNGRRRRS